MLFKKSCIFDVFVSFKINTTTVIRALQVLHLQLQIRVQYGVVLYNATPYINSKSLIIINSRVRVNFNFWNNGYFCYITWLFLLYNMATSCKKKQKKQSLVVQSMDVAVLQLTRTHLIIIKLCCLKRGYIPATNQLSFIFVMIFSLTRKEYQILFVTYYVFTIGTVELRHRDRQLVHKN